MGRLVAQIPNEDPARLARVQDAKWRTIGVSKASCIACVMQLVLVQLQHGMRFLLFALRLNSLKH